MINHELHSMASNNVHNGTEARRVLDVGSQPGNPSQTVLDRVIVQSEGEELESLPAIEGRELEQQSLTLESLGLPQEAGMVFNGVQYLLLQQEEHGPILKQELIRLDTVLDEQERLGQALGEPLREHALLALARKRVQSA